MDEFDSNHETGIRPGAYPVSAGQERVPGVRQPGRLSQAFEGRVSGNATRRCSDSREP